MSKFLIFTDPHLGKNLSSHTTAASRAKLKFALLSQALACAMKPADQQDVGIVCGGDLFDTYSNDEDVIQAAAAIVKRCDVVMGGNHDMVNNADKMGSLQLLAGLITDNGIITAPYNDSHVMAIGPLTIVPHHSTQALFEEALEEAEGYAKNHPYLLLHCNYDSEFASDDISLNLTDVRAKQLLAAGFKRIFLGHEHQPRDLHGGRVIIIGNTHPTGFADISDKRVIALDTDTDTVESRWIWKAEDSYLRVDVDDFLAVESFDDEGLQFLHVKGALDSTQLRSYAQQLKKAWKESPDLLALRSEVTVRGGEKAGIDSQEFTRITDRITAELGDRPELLALWKEICPATTIEAE